MKTNVLNKSIVGISLMALFIVGCSGGDQNATRPSFQSPSSSRSFPLSGGTSSSGSTTSTNSSGDATSGSTTGGDTTASAPGEGEEQATPNELLDAINQSTAAANSATDAANKANSTAKGAQTAAIIAAALAGVGIAGSAIGDYLVNSKSSERDEKISSGVSEVGQKVDRNLEVDVAGHAGTQLKVDSVASSQTGVIQRLDARDVADSYDAELARTRHDENMGAISENREMLELAKNLLLEEVKKLATAEQVNALTQEINKAASREDLEKVQTKLIEAFEFQTKKADMVSAVVARLSADSEQAPDLNLTELLLRIRAASNESELASIMQPYEEQLLYSAGIQVVTNPAGAPCFEECTPAAEHTDDFRAAP